VLKMFWGPLDNPENHDLSDVSRRELTSLIPLVALVVLFGFVPSLITAKMNPSVTTFLRGYDRKLLDSAQGGGAHLLKPLPSGPGLALADDEP